MVELRKPPPRMTLAAFLEHASGTDGVQELVDGAIVAMAPGSRAHARLAGGLVLSLGKRLKPPCLASTQGCVLPGAAADTFLVPAVLVDCGTPAGDEIPVPDPVLVAEVLSPSTAKHDRGVKLPLYQEMASVRHVLLLHQGQRRIDHFRRTALGWEQTKHLAGGTLTLDAFAVALPVDEVYEGVA